MYNPRSYARNIERILGIPPSSTGEIEKNPLVFLSSFLDEKYKLNEINAKFAKWSNPIDEVNHIIYDGEADWDETLNTAEDLANGKIKFPFKWCPLCVAEHIVFEDTLDISIITKTLNA